MTERLATTCCSKTDKTGRFSLPAAERGVIAIMLLAAGAVKVWQTVWMKFDSDESQHLHVVWQWTQGLVQYRDFFDNHTPLFHMMLAPLLSLLGERADIVVLMRLTMIPFYMMIVALTYVVVRQTFSARTAGWSAVLAALLPNFVICSTQFRPDVMWAAMWMVMVAVLMSGRFRPARGLLAGIVLGLTAAVSVKTCLLMACLGMTGAAMVVVFRQELRGRGREIALTVLAMAAGTAIIPAGLAVYFWRQGAIEQMLYCTVLHNVFPSGFKHNHLLLGLLIIPLSMLLCWLGYFIKRISPAGRGGMVRVFVVLLGSFFTLLITTLWPIHTQQSYLPAYPLAVAAGGAIAASLLPQAIIKLKGARAEWLKFAIPAGAAAVELAVVLAGCPRQDGTVAQREFLADVLRISDRGDYVMDLKGEMIYRRRCHYFVLEEITSKRLAMGLLPNNIVRDIIAHRACIMWGGKRRLTAEAYAFMEANYMAVKPNSVRVLGQGLLPAGPGEPVKFKTVFPAEYQIVTAGGAASGQLDGSKYTGKRMLAAGEHVYIASPGESQIRLVWSRAVERGQIPFWP